MRILFVEDSTTMRTIVRRSLAASGMIETIEATSADQGLELFRSGGFDLVLTDWNMPNKTGLELARDIRATSSPVPIVMITTESEKGRVVEAIQAGVSDYLVKPFTPDALREKLSRYRLDA